MIVNEAGRLVVTVPMVIDNARALLDAGRASLQPGALVFDLSRVGAADSSAVAVMLGWLRAASQSRSTLTFAEIPHGVRSLAELYGVTDLLPLA